MTNQSGVTQGKTNGMKPKWYFSKHRPNNRARNSQVEKFFRSDAVEDLANAIVREGIQNSLDAGISFSNNATKGKSINIQIAFGE